MNPEKIPRDFVHYPAGVFKGEIQVLGKSDDVPETSVVIPTFDAYRDGYFPELLDQLKEQSYKDFEVIIVKGDTRQGRAINTGVALARGKYIIILDDDTRLGTPTVFEKLIDVLRTHPEIGMAGVPNLVPQDASCFVRAVMRQVPRRSSPMVTEIVDSDLAEHPCCAIPRDVFIEIGGENELIPRGLDPYLRAEIRKAGYRVVVIPEVYIHHLPPDSLWKFIKQIFRNGKMAAFVNKFYPEFVIELTTRHGEQVRQKRSLIQRTLSFIWRFIQAIFTLKFIYFINLIAYGCGYVYGYLFQRRKEED